METRYVYDLVLEGRICFVFLIIYTNTGFSPYRSVSGRTMYSRHAERRDIPVGYGWVSIYGPSPTKKFEIQTRLVNWDDFADVRPGQSSLKDMLDRVTSVRTSTWVTHLTGYRKTKYSKAETRRMEAWLEGK